MVSFKTILGAATQRAESTVESNETLARAPTGVVTSAVVILATLYVAVVVLGELDNAMPTTGTAWDNSSTEVSNTGTSAFSMLALIPLALAAGVIISVISRISN